jgi:hypothetical protein
VAISRAKKVISIVGYEDSYSKALMPVKGTVTVLKIRMMKRKRYTKSEIIY